MESGASMRTFVTLSCWPIWFAVENARKMSPLLLAPMPPTQASPVVARRRGRRLGAVRRHDVGADLAPDRNAVDAQEVAGAVIRLHQGAHRIALAALGHKPRGGARAALELVADHAGAAADIALGDGLAGDRRI